MTKRRLTREEIIQAINLWMVGAGRVPEIAQTMGRPESTIYSLLKSAGVWPGIDDYTLAPQGMVAIDAVKMPGRGGGLKVVFTKKRKPRQAKQKPQTQELPVIMIEPPKRSLWQRIKGMFD